MYLFFAKTFVEKKEILLKLLFQYQFVVIHSSVNTNHTSKECLFPMSVQGVPIEKYINKRKTPYW